MYRNLIFASGIAIVLSMTVFAYGAVKVKAPDINEVGKAAGASCDVQQAYAFLKTRTIAHYKNSIQKLDPEFACRLAAFFKAANCGQIYSAVRSRADHARISGNSNGAGRPGVNSFATSCHTYGLAVDVSGCYQKRGLMAQYKLHFPYNTTHIQCIEHRRPSCSPQTKTCSGGKGRGTVADVLGQGGGAPPMADSGGGGGAPQGEGGGASSGGGAGSPQGESGSQAGDGYNPYSNGNDKKYTLSDFAKSNKITPIASISCTPSDINPSERVKIRWNCGGNSTRSRGGATQPQSTFRTQGSISGSVFVYPTVNTKYKVQCFNGVTLIGDAICSVEVKNPSANTNISQKSIMYIAPERSRVGWMGNTNIYWITQNVNNCIVRAGRRVYTGERGWFNTGRIYRNTLYTLQCDTPQGSKTVKTEVKIW